MDIEKKGLKPFKDRIWLARPLMHGDEQKYVKRAFELNWITTEGENVNEVERIGAEYIGTNYAAALSCGTAALHMAVKLAGERFYGKPRTGEGTLYGQKVFCSDVTFDATVNPIVYEGGEPVFIDTDVNDTWCMDPKALEKAFEIYPDVKIVMLVHLYGTPAKIDEIKAICDAHGAILIEDAAESMGATYKGKQTGSIGSLGVCSFNGNKLLTGSSGGILLTNERAEYEKVKKWSTQAREAAPWYQHEELGYNYRMSNIIAGIIRGQFEHIDEHLAKKKEIYDRYREGLKDLPVSMNPYEDGSVPNYWLSCLIIDKDAMCRQVRSDTQALYIEETGKSCPTEIMETLAKLNAEARPIWKPMHMQPIYRMNPFITKNGNGRAGSNAYIEGIQTDAGMDLFERGVCLPSDINMTGEEQEKVIEIIKKCFE